MRSLLRSFLLPALLLAALPGFAGSKKIDLVKVQTPQGVMLFYLYEATPVHRENFLRLSRSGVYTGTTFHRVIPGFVIQGGDPNSKDADPANDGEGGPRYTGLPNTQRDAGDTATYTLPAEIKPGVYHRRGTLAAARNSDQVNPARRSSGSQFYVVLGRKYNAEELDMQVRRRGMTLNDSQKKIYTTLGGVPHLDGQYTVFGEVVLGMAVAESIAAQPRSEADRPNTNISMTVTVFSGTPAKLAKKLKLSEADMKAMLLALAGLQTR